MKDARRLVTQAEPSQEAINLLLSSLGSDAARVLSVDTRNPLGGRGGSLSSEAGAWLVRQLATEPERGVVVATRHRSRDLSNTRVLPGSAPRILGDELVPLLLAHSNVLGWIGGTRQRPGTRWHGPHACGLWELTPSCLGFGSEAWSAFLRRRAVAFSEGTRTSRMRLATA